MKKTTIFSIGVSIALLSCNNNAKQNEHQTVSGDTIAEQSFKDEHSSKNSLNWEGTYEGTLPCADCEGIKTNIVLHKDGTFTSKEEYLKEPNFTVENKGSFTWDDLGSIVTLKDGEDYNRSFKVIENAIVQLDTDGNEISGTLAEYYKLGKK